jgi:hypothetical protein
MLLSPNPMLRPPEDDPTIGSFVFFFSSPRSQRFVRPEIVSTWDKAIKLGDTTGRAGG